jgi:AcrR family transcriptional regulator
VDTRDPTPVGRPRSEAARRAILDAADSLLVEEGYAAMTIKGIAARAGVGKQTVYRWWSSKAEILLEATVEDAAAQLATAPAADSLTDLTHYAEASARFLSTSRAGLAYRALLGEAQHDHTVADLLRDADLLGSSTRGVLQRAIERGDLPARADLADAGAEFIGPIVFRSLLGSAEQSRTRWRRYVVRFLARADI